MSQRRAFSWTVRESMYRSLAAQIGNGKTPVAAMEGFQKRLTRRNKTASAAIIDNIIRRLQNGNSLTDAMASWIPQDELMMIASGELANDGELAKAIELLLIAKERMQRVKKGTKVIINSVAGGAFAIYAFLFVVGKYVTPALAGTVPPEKATGLAVALFNLGDFFTSLWCLTPPLLLGGLTYAIIRSYPTWTGKYRTLADNHFPYSFYRDLEGYKWLQSFASLQQSGMPETKILSRQLDTATPWLKERLIATESLMANGSSLSQALQGITATGDIKPKSNFGFPNPDIIDDIESMQGYPDSAARINKRATQWAAELEESMTDMIKRVEQAVNLSLYAIMGFIYLAGQSLSEQMSNSMPM